MSLDPILSANPVIQIHMSMAIISVLFGPMALYRRNRDITHKIIGYIWLFAMVAVAVSSFWIREIRASGDLSPIHILSVITILSVVWSLISVYRGNIRAHRKTLKNLYFCAIGGSLIFNFLPGRLTATILFGQSNMIDFGYAAMTVLILGVGLRLLETKRILIA